MINVLVYYGPEKEFKKRFYPEGLVLNFGFFVQTLDLLNRGIGLKLESKFDSLVVESSEYARANDHVIEGFPHLLQENQQFFGYESIVLHNPPIKIVEQLERAKDLWDVKVIHHKFPPLNKSILTAIKDTFDANVFGQEQAKWDILQTLFPLTNPQTHTFKKPMTLMLYGPPGVGKTETAKLLNRTLNGGRLFRKQMSMLHNEQSQSYMFGDRSRSFAKDLLDRETNVLLLDEFDKADPRFYNAFYQMFDEGIFEDDNYAVPVDDAIILCTSNYLSEKDIRGALGSALCSRFDALVPYQPLSQEAKESILGVAYATELSKYNDDDRAYLENFHVDKKLTPHLTHFENARDIQKEIAKLLAYPFVKKL